VITDDNFDALYNDWAARHSLEPSMGKVLKSICHLWFVRGMTQKVKRKYVEILARARQTSITTQVVAQDANGETVNRVNKHTAVRYPFSVMYDPSPKGGAWMKQLLASA